MGVRRCLTRFLTSLEPLRTPKSANSPRSNSFRPDFPLTTPSNRGRKTSYQGRSKVWFLFAAQPRFGRRVNRNRLVSAL